MILSNRILLSIVVIIICAGLVLIIEPLSSYPKKIKIAVYDDVGTWKDGLFYLEKFLKSRNITYTTINSENVLKGKIGKYDIFIMPGGWAYSYYVKLEKKGNDIIKKYIKNGGNFIGICAGAFYAAKTIIWENNTYSYGLGLLDIYAIGPKKECPWPGFSYINIKMNRKGIKADLNSSYNVLYYGGPEFYLKDSNIKIIARYEDDNMPAIIYGKYGKGKVILTGVHLEINRRNWVILDYMIKLLYPNYTFDFQFSRIYIKMFDNNMLRCNCPKISIK